VSFADCVNNGWLVAPKSSKQEIGNLLGIVARDLKDSQAKDVSDDYNAALQAATAALAAAGYRASRENHHYRVIQSLELTLGKMPSSSAPSMRSGAPRHVRSSSPGHKSRRNVRFEIRIRIMRNSQRRRVPLGGRLSVRAA
jgi:hypothetical protein